MFHMQRQRRLPEEHARFYSAEICLALNFLHDRGERDDTFLHDCKCIRKAVSTAILPELRLGNKYSTY